jgi:hypothetical protein
VFWCSGTVISGWSPITSKLRIQYYSIAYSTNCYTDNENSYMLHTVHQIAYRPVPITSNCIQITSNCCNDAMMSYIICFVNRLWKNQNYRIETLAPTYTGRFLDNRKHVFHLYHLNNVDYIETLIRLWLEVNMGLECSETIKGRLDKLTSRKIFCDILSELAAYFNLPKYTSIDCIE